MQQSTEQDLFNRAWNGDAAALTELQGLANDGEVDAMFTLRQSISHVA